MRGAALRRAEIGEAVAVVVGLLGDAECAPGGPDAEDDAGEHEAGDGERAAATAAPSSHGDGPTGRNR